MSGLMDDFPGEPPTPHLAYKMSALLRLTPLFKRVLHAQEGDLWALMYATHDQRKRMIERGLATEGGVGAVGLSPLTPEKLDELACNLDGFVQASLMHRLYVSGMEPTTLFDGELGELPEDDSDE